MITEGSDIRRVGRRINGTYWDSGQEAIDLLSGNLNFVVPLIRAGVQGGPRALVTLSHNSQLWQQVTGGLLRHGIDSGFGYGWRLQMGRSHHPEAPT